MANVDIIGSEFWENHQYILREEKCRYEYVKKFDINHRLPPCNWTVVRINACQFERFTLIHSFNKPNDWTSLRLINASASLMMESFPDIYLAMVLDTSTASCFRRRLNYTSARKA
ncbi:hypothetical protein GUJ93_ZPchr0388g2755 [Zizania palustris]|uniref:tRNAHis guanylyltransferase catalytic domain-containing protein n=1 Tax=Zizania palustris TaxID=103762 RepID=A0A8J5R922_ZIZPA|nr:hypothetical protein GUJ93_ZPchr0388g2755 [Zizania palustris]